MTRSCTVYSGKLILTVRVFLSELALGMDENAPSLELKHSGICKAFWHGKKPVIFGPEFSKFTTQAE